MNNVRGLGAAVVITTLAAPWSLVQAQSSGSDRPIEEVVVTATKRESNVRDIAGAVSALTGEHLSEIGAQSLEDYITTIPGVTFNNYQPGVSEVVIRGISSTTYHEQGQTVVGYYVNQVPLSEPGWPIVIPDIDTFDLERVEVLRGPQGTLFGSSSLGGLVDYVAREADPSGFDAAVEGTLGGTRHADGTNYAMKGMINVPVITDELAVRAVVLERFDGGYIDNVATGEDDANDLKTRGARLSAVWEATDSVDLSWLTLFQKSELDDQTYVTVPTLTRDTVVAEAHEPELMIHSLRMDADVGIGTLTALASYADKESRIVFDQTLTGYLQGTPTRTVGNASSDSVTLEVRLASQGDERFSWLVGAMYQDSDKESADDVIQSGAEAFVDANPGDFGGYPGSLLAPNDVLSSYQVDQQNEEYALFGEVSFAITETVEATLGGRLFDSSTESTVTRPPSAQFIGSFDPLGSAYTEGADETGFTPKVSISYRPNETFMAYALYSEGFRVGGANPNPPSATGAGATTAYDSDTVENYEIGLRSDWLDSRLRIDAAIFHIDWQDIQVRLFTPAPLFLAYVTNAGGAEIDGVEFSLSLQGNQYFSLDSNVTWQDAELEEFLPDTFAPGGGHAAGTTLPGSSEWSLANRLTFFLPGPWQPTLSIGHQYLSDAPVAFNSLTERGGYDTFDVRATASPLPQIDVSLFVDNAGDEYGIVNSPFGDFYPAPLASVLRPRTYGLTVNWSAR